MTERRKGYRRMEDKTNGWSKAEPLIVHRLDFLKDAVEKLTQAAVESHDKIEEKIESVRKEMTARFHVAPCQEIIKVKEDSGNLKTRVEGLEERDRESRRTRIAIISIGLTLIGLLSGILWNLANGG